MKHVLITGGRGFLGRNLAEHLGERKDCETAILGRENSAGEFREKLLEADVVFHLAGVNRPKHPIEFERGNAELTEQICRLLLDGGRSPKIIFSSSIQAELDNPYGASKARAEKALQQFAAETGACVRIYRLKNLFGKWCRPNYNSVTATFCHNIANNLPIAVSDPAWEVELSYVEDVVKAFLQELEETAGERNQGTAGPDVPSFRIRLGDLAGRIQAFHEMRTTLVTPDFSEWFNRALYATYLSYVPTAERRNNLEIKAGAGA